MAEEFLGPQWKKKFLKEMKKARGIEKIIL